MSSQCSSKCSSIGITWGHVRNAESQPLSPALLNPDLHFNKDPGHSQAHCTLTVTTPFHSSTLSSAGSHNWMCVGITWGALKILLLGSHFQRFWFHLGTTWALVVLKARQVILMCSQVANHYLRVHHRPPGQFFKLVPHWPNPRSS